MKKDSTPKKLWKVIGTTQQKFDRDSSRSPSFDRSSLARSKQARSISSQDLSISKKEQHKNIFEIKIKKQANFQNFCQNVNNLGLQINEDPEQDLQSVYASEIFRSELKNKDQFGGKNYNDHTQLQLLQLVFQRKTNSPTRKRNQKNKLLVFKQKIKRLRLSHCQVQRLVKYQFNQFTREMQKNQRLIKSFLDQINNQSFNHKQDQNILAKENYELRNQLLKAYSLISDIQFKRQKERNQLLKTQQQLEIGSDNQTIKYEESKKKKRINNGQYYPSADPQQTKINNLHQSCVKSRRFQQNIQINKHEKSNNHHESVEIQRKHIEVNRLKFKRYLNQKKQKLNSHRSNEQKEQRNVIKFTKMTSQQFNAINKEDQESIKLNLTAQKFYKVLPPFPLNDVIISTKPKGIQKNKKKEK